MTFKFPAKEAHPQTSPILDALMKRTPPARAVCPDCKGAGELLGRVQYRDGRPCEERMLPCPTCNGRYRI